MKKVNVTLYGSKKNRTTLKAKVWLDLQKVPYSFIDLCDPSSIAEKSLNNAIIPDLSVTVCSQKSTVDFINFFPEQTLSFSKLLSIFENNPILKNEPILVYQMDSPPVALYANEVVIGFSATNYLNLIDGLYSTSQN